MKTNVILISICFFKVGCIREIMEGLPEAKKLKIGEEERNKRTFLCDLCDNIFASKPSLKKHKEAKHEGIRYPCDQCEYSATRISYLKKHKVAKHEGIEYPCDMSDIFQGYLEPVQEPELIEVSEMYEKDKEIKTELDIDPLSVINYDDTENNATLVDMNKRKTMNSDFEFKIEKEDFVLKTESSD